mmetsp:Transcript_17028/g.28724  ORF Transcript_17028/g.28724 Transcript_17028/m.28724 type:complete len:304 (+) Transcript_17028:67-978(+)
MGHRSKCKTPLRCTLLFNVQKSAFLSLFLFVGAPLGSYSTRHPSFFLLFFLEHVFKENAPAFVVLLFFFRSSWSTKLRYSIKIPYIAIGFLCAFSLLPKTESWVSIGDGWSSRRHPPRRAAPQFRNRPPESAPRGAPLGASGCNSAWSVLPHRPWAQRKSSDASRTGPPFASAPHLSAAGWYSQAFQPRFARARHSPPSAGGGAPREGLSGDPSRIAPSSWSRSARGCGYRGAGQEGRAAWGCSGSRKWRGGGCPPAPSRQTAAGAWTGKTKWSQRPRTRPSFRPPQCPRGRPGAAPQPEDPS